MSGTPNSELDSMVPLPLDPSATLEQLLGKIPDNVMEHSSLDSSPEFDWCSFTSDNRDNASPDLSHELMASMLVNAASTAGRRKRYPIFRHFRSKTFHSILKALVVYAAKTNPTEAVNLFKPHSPEYSLRNPDCEQKSWRFLVYLNSSQFFRHLDHVKRFDLAKKMTTVMHNGLSVDHTILYQCKVAWIVGYWLSKLYEIHGFTTSLPEELSVTRDFFLAYFGQNLKDSRILIPPVPAEECLTQLGTSTSLQRSMSVPASHNSDGGPDLEIIAEYPIFPEAGVEVIAEVATTPGQDNMGLGTGPLSGHSSGMKRRRFTPVEEGTPGKETITSEPIQKLLTSSRTDAVMAIAKKINDFGISLLDDERVRIQEVHGRGESILFGLDLENETVKFRRTLNEVRNWAQGVVDEMQNLMQDIDGEESTCIPLNPILRSSNYDSDVDEGIHVSFMA